MIMIHYWLLFRKSIRVVILVGFFSHLSTMPLPNVTCAGYAVNRAVLWREDFHQTSPVQWLPDNSWKWLRRKGCLKLLMFLFLLSWVFPKNRDTPKWMVYNGNPYKNGWNTQLSRVVFSYFEVSVFFFCIFNNNNVLVFFRQFCGILRQALDDHRGLLRGLMNFICTVFLITHGNQDELLKWNFVNSRIQANEVKNNQAYYTYNNQP